MINVPASLVGLPEGIPGREPHFWQIDLINKWENQNHRKSKNQFLLWFPRIRRLKLQRVSHSIVWSLVRSPWFEGPPSPCQQSTESGILQHRTSRMQEEWWSTSETSKRLRWTSPLIEAPVQISGHASVARFGAISWAAPTSWSSDCLHCCHLWLRSW